MIDIGEAIKIARKKSDGKICRLQENEKAYIITFASETGVVPIGSYPLRVDKRNGELVLFHWTHPEFFTPLKDIPFPKGQGDIFVKPKPPEE